MSSLASGPDQSVAHCCFEHPGQNSVLTEAPGHPADRPMEEVAERVAAIDVAKASGMVCIRLSHEKIPGRRVTKVWQVSATTNAIMTLADELAGLGIERVVVESTSDYWRSFVYLLEARGLNVWLVNAQSVKQVPGRPKTDKLDAVWLAKLTERGMLRPSFIPPIEIRQLNPYLKGVLGEAAAAAARTDTFLGERYRRLVKRVGKLKALVAVARSILVIVWHLLANPTVRFGDLGADFYITGVNNHRKVRNLVHQAGGPSWP